MRGRAWRFALWMGVAACGMQADEPSRGPSGETSIHEQPEAELRKIEGAIEEQLKRLRDVEGREGILAEERRYSHFDEELIIRDFFQDRRDGFFLDVGCAWPIQGSNTYYLERHLDWKGIGIDAIAEFGPEWERERPGSRFFSYLVTDQSGIRETFFRSPLVGLSSSNPEMAKGKIFGFDLEPVEVRIETITLDDLLDREGVTRIDLLSMDIEGHEPKALAGFEIERFRPELVVIERPVGPAGAAGDPVARYFERHGYTLIDRYDRFDPVNRYFEPKGPRSPAR